MSIVNHCTCYSQAMSITANKTPNTRRYRRPAIIIEVKTNGTHPLPRARKKENAHFWSSRCTRNRAAGRFDCRASMRLCKREAVRKAQKIARRPGDPEYCAKLYGKIVPSPEICSRLILCGFFENSGYTARG